MRRAEATCAALLWFTVLGLGCAARATAQPTGPQRPTLAQAPANPSAAERIRQELSDLFNAPHVEHAQWAVNIYSLRSAETLYSYNAFRFMVPASNQKLLTSATAAERLGWDYRFTTRILAAGPINEAGTLNGNLIVTSNGDPSINPRHADRWGAFDAWATALREKGLRIINGDLIGDDNAFAEPGWGVGWAWDNLQYGYGTPTGALQFNENQVELLIGPGSETGARAIISTSPLGHGLIIDHRVTTGAAGTETSIDLERNPGTTVLVVRGQIAADAKPRTLTASVENPTRLYLSAFRDALYRHGIHVGGKLLDVDDLPAAAVNTATATELLVDRSPPLAEIIDVTLKWSRNGYAETMLLAMSPPDAPATGSAGLDAMRETLRQWGIAPDAYLPRDGSGLSRYDYVSANALTSLLTYLWRDPKHAELFRSTLPVSGVSGSLAERMKGTPAEARVWAKTGTLSNVRALSGYVVTLAGEPFAFSMMANNYRVPTSQVDEIMEKALVRLVEFKR
jgi:D-alanyl-D-alanine carboxypeptidase/D-alanyl-D-alanine-endopeptidase (penicillin-binding protein 4)